MELGLIMVNNYRLGLYEKSMPNTLTWREKLICCKECGFDWLEMSIDETDEKLARLQWTDKEINELKREMEQIGIPISTICLSGHRKYPMGSIDEKDAMRSMEIMNKAIELAYKLGVRIIQLAGYDVYYSQGSDKTKKLFESNLQKATLLASQYGIILGFETMETEFMDTVEKSMEYVSKVDSPYLGVYPDIGNLTNAAKKYGHDVLEDLKNGKGHIVAAHLKETLPGQYREIPFGEGHTDFYSTVTCLKSMGVSMFVGEFWYVGQANWKEDCLFANKFLRNILNKI